MRVAFFEAARFAAETNLPTSGKIVLYEKDGSYICHMLYANIVKRGDGIEVIEDLATIADVSVTLRLPRGVSRAALHPEEREVPLIKNDDSTVSFTLDRFYCSAIVELS